MNDVDRMTQQNNAALVEQSTAATEQLAEQTNKLSSMVDFIYAEGAEE